YHRFKVHENGPGLMGLELPSPLLSGLVHELGLGLPSPLHHDTHSTAVLVSCFWWFSR
ncbi:hypothetical protein Ancab_004673, partial [Ancistrocladus abbreviatus]